jgi:hypothetical protein
VKTIRFENKEDARLSPQCEAELFQGVRWKEDDLSCMEGIEVRRVEARIEEEDAVMYGGSMFYGDVSVSQERYIDGNGDVLGSKTTIVPMDTAKFKTMQGRVGFYGAGCYKNGSSPSYGN